MIRVIAASVLNLGCELELVGVRTPLKNFNAIATYCQCRKKLIPAAYGKQNESTENKTLKQGCFTRPSTFRRFFLFHFFFNNIECNNV